jgi:hypothetical protein
MKLTLGLLATFGLCFVLASGTSAEESLKSGPQVGEKVPGPFHPLNVTGEQAGKQFCLYCVNGQNPVAMVFARTADCPQMAKLLKKIDETTVKNAKSEMGSFAVFLSESKDLEDKLKDLAKKEDLKKCVLSIDNLSGPKDYNVSKDADLTVVLYVDRKVQANYSFKKGEIKDADIEKVIADVSKIVK